MLSVVSCRGVESLAEIKDQESSIGCVCWNHHIIGQPNYSNLIESKINSNHGKGAFYWSGPFHNLDENKNGVESGIDTKSAGPSLTQSPVYTKSLGLNDQGTRLDSGKLGILFPS